MIIFLSKSLFPYSLLIEINSPLNKETLFYPEYKNGTNERMCCITVEEEKEGDTRISQSCLDPALWQMVGGISEGVLESVGLCHQQANITVTPLSCRHILDKQKYALEISLLK